MNHVTIDNLQNAIEKDVCSLQKQCVILSTGLETYENMLQRKQRFDVARNGGYIDSNYATLLVDEHHKDLLALGLYDEAEHVVSFEADDVVMHLGLTFDVDWSKLGTKIWEAIKKLIQAIKNKLFEIFRKLARMLGIISNRGMKVAEDVRYIKDNIGVLKEYVFQSNNVKLQSNYEVIATVDSALSLFAYVKNEARQSVDFKYFYEQQVKGGSVLLRDFISRMESLDAAVKLNSPSSVHASIDSYADKIFVSNEKIISSELYRVPVTYNSTAVKIMRVLRDNYGISQTHILPGKVEIIEQELTTYKTGYDIRDAFDEVVSQMVTIDFNALYEDLARDIQTLESIVSKALTSAESSIVDTYNRIIPKDTITSSAVITSQKVFIGSYAAALGTLALSIAKDFVGNFKDVERVSGSFMSLTKEVVSFIDGNPDRDAKGVNGLIKEYIFNNR